MLYGHLFSFIISVCFIICNVFISICFTDAAFLITHENPYRALYAGTKNDILKTSKNGLEV